MRHLFSYAIVSCIVAVGPAACRAMLAAEEPRKISIKAVEIGSTVQIIGRLGKPMGTLMSLRGQWRMPSNTPKPPALEFHVTHVDGQRLSNEVVFYKCVVTAFNQKHKHHHEADGVVWEMQALEEGRFVNLTDRYWKEFYGMPVALPDYGQGPFACFLTGNVKKESRPAAAAASPAKPK
jgi:hypothetical protein